MIDLKHFEFIYIKHWEKLYAFCFRMTCSESLAQSIVQDVFADLWERRKEVNILSIQNYLFQAAKNEVLKDNLVVHISSQDLASTANFMQDEYDLSEWDTTQMGPKAAISATVYKNIKKRNQLKKPFRIHYKYAIAAIIVLVIALGILLKPQTVVKENSIRKLRKDRKSKSVSKPQLLETTFAKCDFIDCFLQFGRVF